MELITKQQLISELKPYSLDTDSQVLKALEISERIHKDQIRDSGNSYLEEHIYPVVSNLVKRQSSHTKLQQLVVVALLHDTVEDGDLADGYLTEQFDSEVEKYVMGVTKKKVVLTERPTQEWLFNQMKESIVKVEEAGEVSQIVKMEDRIQNMESTGMNLSKKEKYLRMVNEMKELFIPLAVKMNIDYGYVDALNFQIDRIEKMFE
jgi:(p)ppGpp synthase/HD superfamily hydrolase